MESSRTRLSVNINKFATLRNARGGNLPDLLRTAQDCEAFGAEGITVHPRPDERHIRYQDVRDLKSIVKTEFNIEGNPSESFMELVDEVRPEQVTLVPDGPDVLTSNAGWDTIKEQNKLIPIVETLKKNGCRVSIFIDPIPERIKAAKDCGTDRIELYTEAYASNFNKRKEEAVSPYNKAAEEAVRQGIGINAGHDLNLHNLEYFQNNVPNLLEVSIGHALVCDALYLGLENTIQLYKSKLS